MSHTKCIHICTNYDVFSQIKAIPKMTKNGLYQPCDGAGLL